jgi:hypothetical protein
VSCVQKGPILEQPYNQELWWGSLHYSGLCEYRCVLKLLPEWWAVCRKGLYWSSPTTRNYGRALCIIADFVNVLSLKLLPEWWAVCRKGLYWSSPTPGPTSQDAETPSHSGFHPPHLLYNRRGLTRNNSEFRRPEMWAQDLWSGSLHYSGHCQYLVSKTPARVVSSVQKGPIYWSQQPGIMVGLAAL